MDLIKYILGSAARNFEPLQESGSIDVYKFEIGDQPIVLKTFDLSNNMEKYYVNERESLRRLQHVQDIPELIDYDIRSQVGFIIREYVTGIDLNAFTDSISRTQYACFLKHLRDIHREGIAPLDLHEENILLSRGRLQVFDFDKVEFRENISQEKWKSAIQTDRNKARRYLRHRVKL